MYCAPASHPAVPIRAAAATRRPAAGYGSVAVAEVATAVVAVVERLVRAGLVVGSAVAVAVVPAATAVAERVVRSGLAVGPAVAVPACLLRWLWLSRLHPRLRLWLGGLSAPALRLALLSLFRSCLLRRLWLSRLSRLHPLLLGLSRLSAALWPVLLLSALFLLLLRLCLGALALRILLTLALLLLRRALFVLPIWLGVCRDHRPEKQNQCSAPVNRTNCISISPFEFVSSVHADNQSASTADPRHNQGEIILCLLLVEEGVNSSQDFVSNFG